MPGRSHFAFWLLLAALLAVLPPLASGPHAVHERFAAERSAVRLALGPVLGARAVAMAHGWGGLLRPSRSEPRVPSGLPVLDAASRWLDQAGRAWAWQWQLVTLRLALGAAWLLLLLPLWAAVLADAFAVRRRTFETLGYQNPAAFSWSLHAAIALAAWPLLYLVAPVAVTPFFLPLWSLAAALPVAHALTHAQPVFGR